MLITMLLAAAVVVAVEEGIRLMIKGYAEGNPWQTDLPPWP